MSVTAKLHQTWLLAEYEQERRPGQFRDLVNLAHRGYKLDGRELHGSILITDEVFSDHPLGRSILSSDEVFSDHPLGRSILRRDEVFSDHPLGRSILSSDEVFSDHPLGRSILSSDEVFSDHPLGRSISHAMPTRGRLLPWD